MTDVGQQEQRPYGRGNPPPKAKGSLSKSTQLTKLNLRSALQILRNGGGEGPVEAAQKIARFLEGLSKRRMDEIIAKAATLSGEEFDRVVNTLYKAANIQLRLADFVYPKPGRIELMEKQDDAKKPKTMEELAQQLEQRGLPGWILGGDAPVLDLEAEEKLK